MHDGWPVLKNAGGRYCYRNRVHDAWFLYSKFAPDSLTCAAYIVAEDGPLPVGAHTWKVAVRCGATATVVDSRLTVTLVDPGVVINKKK